MSQTLIEQLTPEQEAMIPVYYEKWWKIATSTESLDRSQATEAVVAAYKLIGKKEPEIIFFDSPASAWRYIFLNFSSSLTEVADWIKKTQHRHSRLEEKIDSQISRNLLKKFETHKPIVNTSLMQFFVPIYAAVETIIYTDILFRDREIDRHCIYYCVDMLVNNVYFLDYCISGLNCQPDRKTWDIYQRLMKNVGWFFPFENTCIVCSRPTIVSLDDQQRIHAEGGPAIQYADGLSVYACHGIVLPEKYGKLHPHQWRSQWILEEENAELRRILIQGIGYEKMLQELQAIALDSWQEYTLLRIDADVDVEPIFLLKMTCPSTGFIHALRVPPDIESAIEAIRWVNWGISPDEFQAQS